jgi:putative redox protein
MLLDTVAEYGGADRGARPIELLLLGLGGCTGMDVIGILRKMRQDVTAYEVRVEADRSEQHPKVLTRITVEHVVRGRGLDAAAVRRAVELSATRYCAVSAMLGKSAEIEERFRAIDEVSGAETLETLVDRAA